MIQLGMTNYKDRPFFDYFGLTFEKIKSNLLFITALGFAIYIISFIVSLPLSIFTSFMTRGDLSNLTLESVPEALLSFSMFFGSQGIVSLPQYLVFKPLFLGVLYIIIKTLRDQSVNLEDVTILFKRNYLTYIVVVVIYNLVSFLFTLIFLSFGLGFFLLGFSFFTQDNSPLILVALLILGLLLLLPFVYVALKLSFIPYILAEDDNLSGFPDLIGKSWAMSNGVEFKILGLGISGTLITIAGLFFFIIGVFPAIAFAYSLTAALYLDASADYRNQMLALQDSQISPTGNNINQIQYSQNENSNV